LHHLVESAVREASAAGDVGKPAQASSFVQLQKQAENLWSYRTNPE